MQRLSKYRLSHDVGLFIMLQAFASQVDASATLELLMRSYENPNSKDRGGSSCDLGSQCDHIFRFALDHGDRCDQINVIYFDFKCCNVRINSPFSLCSQFMSC